MECCVATALCAVRARPAGPWLQCRYSTTPLLHGNLAAPV